MDNEVNAYSPICLPTKVFHKHDFVGFDVKMTGYGYTEQQKSREHHPNACKLQVGMNKVVSSNHHSCKNVSRTIVSEISECDRSNDY